MAVLDEILAPVAPSLDRWASVCVLEPNDGPTVAHWYHTRDDGTRRDFWPASTIKVYAAVAALEALEARGFGLESVVIFERRATAGGPWRTDTARSIKEMLSEVFRRSSNEDYTLLLRIPGLDVMNRHFLTPERGFPHSALMRGYVSADVRPYGYRREEAQRITLMDPSRPDRAPVCTEHVWSGRAYAGERGCTVIDPELGNVTSTYELVDCLRRLLCHESLPLEERFRLSQPMVDFLRSGGEGFTGLETRDPDSGPTGWTDGVDAVFPQARFYHKCGLISNYAMDLAAVDDRAASGKWFIFCPVIHAGHATTPVNGEILTAQMSRRIAEAVRDGRL
jgi:Beta-lactamase enzyme family